MRSFVYSVPFIILLSGLASFLGLSRLKQAPPRSTHDKLAPLVETVEVTTCHDGFRIRVDGEVVPYREISLSAEVRGRLTKKSPAAKAGTFRASGRLVV